MYFWGQRDLFLKLQDTIEDVYELEDINVILKKGHSVSVAFPFQILQDCHHTKISLTVKMSGAADRKGSTL